MAEQVNKQTKLEALQAKGVDLSAEKLSMQSTHKELDEVLKKFDITLESPEQEGEDEEEDTKNDIEEAEDGTPDLAARVSTLEGQVKDILSSPTFAGKFGPAHTSVAAPAAQTVPIPDESAEDSVHFTLNDRVTPTRTFTKEEHGDDFNEIADEFHKTNAAKIVSRVHDAESPEEDSKS